MVTFAFDFSGITVTLNSNLATTDNDANDVWTAVLEFTSNLPQFDVDVCVFSGNNCAGGGSGGLLPGELMNVGVTITGAQLPPLTFDAVYARFQSIGPTQGGSDVVQGTTTPVPEPGVLSLVGVGLVAIGLLLTSATLLSKHSVGAWGS